MKKIVLVLCCTERERCLRDTCIYTLYIRIEKKIYVIISMPLAYSYVQFLEGYE